MPTRRTPSILRTWRIETRPHARREPRKHRPGPTFICVQPKRETHSFARAEETNGTSTGPRQLIVLASHVAAGAGGRSGLI